MPEVHPTHNLSMFRHSLLRLASPLTPSQMKSSSSVCRCICVAKASLSVHKPTLPFPSISHSPASFRSPSSRQSSQSASHTRANYSLPSEVQWLTDAKPSQQGQYPLHVLTTAWRLANPQAGFVHQGGGCHGGVFFSGQILTIGPSKIH